MILPFMTKFPGGTKTEFVEKILACTGCEDLPDSTLKRLADLLAPGLDGGDWMIPEIVEGFNPKKHTIREDLKNRWKAGNKIHFVINNRSKNYLQFAPVKLCVLIQKIEITYASDYANSMVVKVDDKCLNIEEQQQLAWNDGFSCLATFQMYFMQDFKGKIIHWTDLKY